MKIDKWHLGRCCTEILHAINAKFLTKMTTQNPESVGLIKLFSHLFHLNVTVPRKKKKVSSLYFEFKIFHLF